MPNTEDSYPSLAEAGPLGAKNIRRQLGRSVKLQGAGGRTRAEVLVFAGGDGPDNFSLGCGDALASTCTITLAIIQQSVGSDEAIAVIEGSIEWGTDGTGGSALFDWRNGGVIVVSGASFKVSAHLLSIPDGRSVEVAAFIGYYTVPGGRAQLTRFATGNASTVIPIAQMAHSVLAQVDDASGVALQFTSDALGTIPLFGVRTIAAGSFDVPVPIPPGAAAVVATPSGALPVPISFLLSM